MSKEIKRNYLEIKSLKELIESTHCPNDFKLEVVRNPDFQLNKFFYKNVGKNYYWIDRLAWSDLDWTKFINNKNLQTYVLKNKNDFAGYFEIIYHPDNNEKEIAYFGLLEEYHKKKLGSYFLTCAIKEAFKDDISRLWLHTCSLDHENALHNYLARGMKIFKEEKIKI